MMKKICLLVAAATIATGAAFGQAIDENFVPGEVLIQFNEAASNEHLQDALTRAGLVVQEHLSADKPGLVRASTKLHTSHAIEALQNHPAIEFAEPNWVFVHQSTASDTYYLNGSLWGVYGDDVTPVGPAGTTCAFGSQAEKVWAKNAVSTEEIVVGVIDEGISYTHPDLAASAWTNPGETGTDSQGRSKESNGIDDDGNGYVDDVHGWDFVHNDNSIFDAADGDHHGTHVTGTIAATGNASGIAGMAWTANVKYISGKFLAPNGGTLGNAIKAVNYFTALKKKGVNVVALNNSWGGGGYSQGLHDSIIRAAKVGIVFVAAAGNGNSGGVGQNNDRSASYPSGYDTSRGTSTESAATYDSVIAVAAIDRYGNKPQWSNYGSRTVDLGAPGVAIISTVPGGYSSYNGTSMATPHVTGAVVLYAASHPASGSVESAASARKQAILSAAVATRTSSMNKTATGGRLNVGGF
jgi:subtilisin family serine protease